MSSWRDTPGLLRGQGPKPSKGAPAGAAEAAGPALDPRWDRLFESLHAVGARLGAPDPLIRLGLSRGRAAARKDPDGARQTLVGLIQLMVASLEIEPAQLYGGQVVSRADVAAAVQQAIEAQRAG